ncbi:hypothetical protein [Prochlorococcus sp. MIT 1205]
MSFKNDLKFLKNISINEIRRKIKEINIAEGNKKMPTLKKNIP